MIYSIKSTELKGELIDNFSKLAEVKATEINKIPTDAFYDILE